MKFWKIFGSLMLLALCSNAFAGQVHYEECKGCDPGDDGDPQVQQILWRWARDGIGQLDSVSIMDDRNGYYVTWKHKNGVWVIVEKGYAKQASSGGSGGGDGRTVVSVGPVIVMYPNPPTATVAVEGIIQAGAGGGGCTLKTSSSACASLTGANPDGSER